MGKAFTSISCAFVYFICIIATTINDFLNRYENCKDDFEVIDKCNCLPDTGNYSYFINKYDMIEGELYFISPFNFSGVNYNED